MSEVEIEVIWQGPYAWPKYDSVSIASLDSVPVDACGIYLWTVEYCNGYLIYAAGITRRPFRKRFREHTRAYLTGVYTVFDMEKLQQGIRTEIWHGFWMKKRSPEKQKEYESRSNEIIAFAQKQLVAYRIFIAIIDPVPRILERLEFAIMSALYRSAPPICQIPDRGMQLSQRWQNERPIIARNIISVKLHGIPEHLVI